jgi:hypothetical protein
MYVQEHAAESGFGQLLGGGPPDAEAVGDALDDAGVRMNDGGSLVCSRHVVHSCQ